MGNEMDGVDSRMLLEIGRDLIDAIRSVTGSFRSFETVTWSGAVSPAAARTSTAVS